MVVLLIVLVLLLLFFIVQAILFFVSQKNNLSLQSIKELYNHFLSYKEKYSYRLLPKSATNIEMKLLLSKQKNLMFCEKALYKNKNFLLTLSQFIDVKINTNKNRYRSKNNLVLIEQIASVVAADINKFNDCKLFHKFNKLRLEYNLKQKEIKIFKILLGQKLLLCLKSIEEEIRQISKIIVKSKKIRRVKRYKKQIYFSAELYSIYKFNPNSSKILYNFKHNNTKNAENLFNELLNTELKFKIILAYLTSMFS